MKTMQCFIQCIQLVLTIRWRYFKAIIVMTMLSLLCVPFFDLLSLQKGAYQKLFQEKYPGRLFFCIRLNRFFSAIILYYQFYGNTDNLQTFWKSTRLTISQLWMDKTVPNMARWCKTISILFSEINLHPEGTIGYVLDNMELNASILRTGSIWGVTERVSTS